MSEAVHRPHGEQDWRYNREIAQEIPFPEFWTLELAQKWASEIPEGIEHEGHESPLVELDLTKEGYGIVFIKNEADRSVNPTGTMKDRIGRSCAAEYRYDAKQALEFRNNDPVYAKRFPEIRIPRYSMLTAGNAGMALAKTFETLDLPPPKLLIDIHADQKTINKLKKTRADIYLVDLSTNPFSGRTSTDSPLTKDEILALTNNGFGTDLTSNNSFQDDNPHITFYHNLATQIFSEKPDEIYVPYGSGALFGEILARQRLGGPLILSGRKMTAEERAQTAKQIYSIKLFGAEPENSSSVADKLSAPAKPFPTMWEKEMDWYKTEGQTNTETGIIKISENEILAGYELLKKTGQGKGIETEPSGSAGLALYMRRWEKGKIKKDAKVIIVNTGKGIISDTKK